MNKTILIADTNSFIGEAFSVALSSYIGSKNLIYVKNLKQVLGKVKYADILFLEYIPQETADIISSIRKDPLLSQVIIIVTYGNKNPLPKQKAWDMGADDLLEKPFEALQVRQKLETFFTPTRTLSWQENESNLKIIDEDLPDLLFSAMQDKDESIVDTENSISQFEEDSNDKATENIVEGKTSLEDIFQLENEEETELVIDQLEDLAVLNNDVQFDEDKSRELTEKEEGDLAIDELEDSAILNNGLQFDKEREDAEESVFEESFLETEEETELLNEESPKVDDDSLGFQNIPTSVENYGNMEIDVEKLSISSDGKNLKLGHNDNDGKLADDAFSKFTISTDFGMNSFFEKEQSESNENMPIEEEINFENLRTEDEALLFSSKTANHNEESEILIEPSDKEQESSTILSEKNANTHSELEQELSISEQTEDKFIASLENYKNSDDDIFTQKLKEAGVHLESKSVEKAEEFDFFGDETQTQVAKDVFALDDMHMNDLLSEEKQDSPQMQVAIQNIIEQAAKDISTVVQSRNRQNK